MKPCFLYKYLATKLLLLTSSKRTLFTLDFAISIITENRFFQSSISQSAYRIVGTGANDLIRGLGTKTFESLSPNNSLTLTLEDLERIAEENNR